MNDALIDSSSAILLFKAGLITVCCRAFRLLMTRSVYAEVAVPTQPGADTLTSLTRRRPGITLLQDPMGSSPLETAAVDLAKLHRGERDTLMHYLNGIAQFVVIDDGKGVQVCRRHGIPHVNALLLPRLLYHTGQLSDHNARRFFRRIQTLGRYSAAVVTWAATCTKTDLGFFFKYGTGTGQDNSLK